MKIISVFKRLGIGTKNTLCNKCFSDVYSCNNQCYFIFHRTRKSKHSLNRRIILGCNFLFCNVRIISCICFWRRTRNNTYTSINCFTINNLFWQIIFQSCFSFYYEYFNCNSLLLTFRIICNSKFFTFLISLFLEVLELQFLQQLLRQLFQKQILREHFTRFYHFQFYYRWF